MRVLRGTLYVKLVLILCVTLTAGFLYLRLAAGPLSFGRLPERVAASLAARIGPGWTVALRNSALELRNGSLALRAVGLDIRNPQGALVLRSPNATVSLDTLSLLTANLHPRSIEFHDLQLRALINRDGSLAFVPGPELADETSGDAAAPAGPGPDRTGPGPDERREPILPNAPDATSLSPLSVAAQSLFDLVFGRTGVIGALDEAHITNAHLVLVDSGQRERATFQRFDATFVRTEGGARRFDATLDGPRGVWRLSGNAAPEGSDGERATLVAVNAPVQDLLLLSGLSGMPVTTNLKLSGRADAVLSAGRLTQFEVQLASNTGSIQVDEKGGTPMLVESASLAATWDESRRVLTIPSIAIEGRDTHVQLHGSLTVPASEPGWRLSLAGANAVVAGAAEGDRPVKLDQIDMQLAGQDGLSVERLSVRGPALSVDASATYGTAADPRSFRTDVHATGTAVRSALRLWPETVTPEVRSYLVSNLKDGTVEKLDLALALTGAELATARAEGPLPDAALRLRFAIRDAELMAADGLPPLVQANVTGAITGTRANVVAASGRAQMADERTLSLTEGSFVVDDFWVRRPESRIQLRFEGGADGLGAFLQTPVMQEIVGLDLDPATMKGKVDLHARLALPLKDIPNAADLPLVITGTVSDLVVDKVMGRERIEGAQLSFSYDRGSLAIKGDAKLSGSPATIEVRQGPNGAGDAVLAFSLDDAARTRKGWPFGSQLTGPVPIRVQLPLGRAAGSGYRVEADLTKAAVDNLFPGWIKAAGRPGKLAFTFSPVEGQPTELRDVQLESGPVLVRGMVGLSPDGQLDRADLTTFKLSPGDDMRALVERAGPVFKVTVRGNVGDARPWTKLLGSASSATGSRDSHGGLASAKDGREFDLDLALNILTGYNDEALTNAVIKASVRGRNLRQLQISGRFGPASVTAQTVLRDRAPSVIVFQSDDAGSTLRFLDVYRRMAGGALVVQLATTDGPQLGSLTLHNFVIRNEPALRRIIPTQSQTVTSENRTGSLQAYRIDVNEVAFTKAKVDFTRTAGRIDFRNAAIWGGEVGFTLNGNIDYARDRMDISGTFVPAYGLNNAFAQVPLFGPLLGGGQYEGLFAVNFRIAGAASAPSVTVNPLSAVAPGFLRKFFGAWPGTDSDDAPVLPQSYDR